MTTLFNKNRMAKKMVSFSGLHFYPGFLSKHSALQYKDSISSQETTSMKLRTLYVVVTLASALVCTTVAQTAAPNSSPASTQVPRLIRFSGVALDETHNPTTGVLGITFSLYQDQQGGSPLWVETQNVQADANGHYTALLGSASAEGMPLELFSSGEAQWLGVQIQGQPEHARVLLVSVPYALKAHEAETLSGRSISDFVLLNKASSSSSSNATDAPASSNGTSASSSPRIDNDGPTNFMGSNATQIVSVTQKGAGLGLSATSHALAAVAGTITGKSNTAVYGLASNTSKGSNAVGVTGQSNTETGAGVYGQSAGISGTGVSGNATAASGYTSGVSGQSASVNGTGVYGSSANWVGVGGQGAVLGVWGDSATITGTGVAGYSDATSGSGNGVYGQTAGTSGSGVWGNATAASGYTIGAFGNSASPNGTGVVGISNATSGGTGVTGVANAATGSPTGVFGFISATSGAALVGVANGTSGYTSGVWTSNASIQGAGVNGNASATSGNATGVFGSSQGSDGGIGAWGSYQGTSGSGVGVRGDIESGASGTAGLFANVSGQGLILSGESGSGFAQVFSVDANGDLDISGNLTVAGSKSARVKLQDGREVALYAVESPENWFEDFGTAQLHEGTTSVSLEPGFLETVDAAAGYHVFLTANGDCRGLYVAGKTPTGFEVRELGQGNASIAFDYRIVARRRGFENLRLQDVHLPQGPKDTQAGVASMRSGARIVAPPAPRATIPVLPHPSPQAH